MSAELEGSFREPMHGARRVGAADPDSVVHFDVILRRAEAPSAPDADGPDGGHSPTGTEAPTGASPQDLDAVTAALRAGGMVIDSADRATRTVRAHGSADRVEAFFHVELGEYQCGDIRYRGREGTISIPEALVGRVQAVLGLDDRPQAFPSR